MERDYVHKDTPIYPIVYSSENVIVKDGLKLKLDNTKKIFSLNQNAGQSKKFNSAFKSFFLHAPPPVSNFQENEKTIVCWIRKNSYFVMGDIDIKSLSSSFNSIASITNQTGGWICFVLSGKYSQSIFEKLVTLDFDSFKKGQVNRTSINKINCFVLCKEKYLNYTIICPISFMESMRTRLISLINLIA
jgi:sarcosine oxidase gamma subunit